jgi:hypothetical protein
MMQELRAPGACECETKRQHGSARLTGPLPEKSARILAVRNIPISIVRATMSRPKPSMKEARTSDTPLVESKAFARTKTNKRPAGWGGSNKGVGDASPLMKKAP